MSEWKEYILADVIDKFIDYRGKTPNKTVSGIPLVTAKIVKAGKILPPNEFIAHEDYDAWMTRGLPEINDLVLTTEAPLGEVALIKDKNVALAQRIITLRGKKEYVFNPFLKYYFQNETGQHDLQSRASGTTVFGIKASVLRELPVTLPLVEEQKSIASVLSSLDDKIDLLHRQNKTLEAMAETLFRQWFVEGDGEWEILKLGDCVTISYGKNLPTKNLLAEGYPVFGANGQIGFYDRYTYEGPQVLVSCRGEASGKVNISLPMSFVTNNSLALERNKRQGVRFEFLKYWALSYDFKLHVSGSAQPQITIDGLYDADFPCPDDRLISEFAGVVEPLEKKLYANTLHISALEKLRDNLLPKLISGEVRVAS